MADTSGRDGSYTVRAASTPALRTWRAKQQEVVVAADGDRRYLDEIEAELRSRGEDL